MDSVIRKKRTNDGVQNSRRTELEEQLAELRDQESELARAIELLQAQTKGQKPGFDSFSPLTGPRPTAEMRDYEMKQRQVRENQRRRGRAFWTDIRKLIGALRNHKHLSLVFGVPVRETQWGSVPQNWERYRQVVSRPIDLRTIKSKLGDDENSLQYTAPHEVVEDIHLIIDNCNTFNSGPAGEGVRKMADQLQQLFEKKWHDGAFERRWQQELARQKVEHEVRSLLSRSCCCSSVHRVSS
jgi:hypothetical protein